MHVYIWCVCVHVCTAICLHGFFCIRSVNTGKHACIYFHITSQEHPATQIKHTGAKCPKVVNEIIKSFSRRL
jgi:hypothetical protein